MNNFRLSFVLLVLSFEIGLGQSQNYYHDLRDGTNSVFIGRIIPLGNQYFIDRSIGNYTIVSIYSVLGQKLHEYVNADYGVTNVSTNNNKFYLHARKFNTSHPDSFRIIILDSALNQLAINAPSKKNWPRLFFSNRSFTETKLQGNIGYFGQFTENDFNDSTKLHGWLILNESADTLEAVELNTAFNATRMGYCYQSDTGFYSLDPITRIAYPWSSTVSVTSISKFDNQMNWQKSANFGMPSNLPGYTRLLESYNSINLAINQQSVYAMAEYEAASPNFLSVTQKSCAIYRFDRELNRIRVVHDTAATGKVAETSATQQIAFDQSGKYLYAVWKECDPYQLFADQTRECATVVLKYDTALNLVWKRVFGIPDMNFHAETMAPSPDGGVLVAGYYIDLPPGPNIRNTFVLKVDSAGNHVVSVPNLSANAASVNVYPNPTSELLHFRWQGDDFNQLLVRDVQGRLMSQLSIEPQSTETQLNVQAWSPGMYFYQLHSPRGQQLQGKFLKR